MNQSRSRLVDLAGLLSNVTALHTLFSIFAFRQTGRSDPAGLLIWCVCLSLTCGGLALFLRRPRTQRSVLLLALAALALQGAVVWLWGVRYPSLLSWLCLLAMWGFSYFRCYELLIRPTPAEQLMVSFETASLVLLAAALCTAAGVLPLDTALAPAAGTLLALAALAGQRASNSRPGGQAAGSLRGRLLLLLLLAALGGGAALCVLLFTGTAAQALTGAAVWNGLVLGSRVLAFAGLGLLFVLTTDRILLVRSLQQQLRLPPVFAYGLLAAWGILPNMMEEYKRTRAAFAARGIRVFPVSPALLKPLLVKSVRWSEELSIAMESRGFDGRVPRTCSQPLRLRPVDVLFPILSCALFLALFFLLGR